MRTLEEVEEEKHGADQEDDTVEYSMVEIGVEDVKENMRSPETS